MLAYYYPTNMAIGATIIIESAAVPMDEIYFAHVCLRLQDVEDGLMRSVVVNLATIPGTAGIASMMTN